MQSTQPLKNSTASNFNVQQWYRVFVNTSIFFIRRLLFVTMVMLALIYLTHLGLDMARGSSFEAAWYNTGFKTITYIQNLFQGDLGLTDAGTLTSVATPVIEIVPELFKRSFGLLIASLLFATIVGIIIGTIAAQTPRVSLGLILLSIVGASLPSFFLALLLQMVLIQWTRIYGVPLLPIGGFGWDKRIILPAVVLAARPMAQITRITFITIRNLLAQDFTRVAFSKGLRDSFVLTRHIARNAAVPILTTVAISLRFSLSSLPVVEYFFGWPGIGFTLLKSIAQQDDNLTVALILCLGLLFMGLNIALEIIYPLIDPRLRGSAKPTQPQDGILSGLKTLLIDLKDSLLVLITNQPTTVETRLKPSPQPTNQAKDKILYKRMKQNRRRLLLRYTLGNIPLMIGTVIVMGLLIVILFGAELAPHSPFATHGIVVDVGQISMPPFEPGETYPWGTDFLGRDLMSLILAGARQTLLLATVVVAARLFIGFVLGAIAGWLNGSWVDRLLLSLAEIIAAFPTLLLTMILIMAFGIRQGLQPFIIAFCFVGWGEVMQFVRGEVMVIRPKQFIESARSIGTPAPRLIFHHVLPNLIPALISLAALEMGAVLILLGELGFIGIFIGGGTLAQAVRGVYHYSDIPEWGALLSNVRLYARSYTWIAFYPTLAFFVVILGFNLLGEGLRTLVNKVGFTINTWVNRYTIVLTVVIFVGLNWVQNNTGPIAYYRQNAEMFDGVKALAHIEALTDSSMTDRALGSPGLDLSATYIGEQFKTLGLQPAGERQTFFFERNRSYQTLDTIPTLTIKDDDIQPAYMKDFKTMPTIFRNFGQAKGEVHFITTGPLDTESRFVASYPILEEFEFANKLLLVLSPRDLAYLRTVPNAGLLVVADDDTILQRNYTLYTRDPVDRTFGANREIGQDAPVLLISEAIANRLLADTGQTVAELRRESSRLITDQLIEFPTNKTVNVSVEGTVKQNQPVKHVLGYIPGTEGVEGVQTLDSQMIIILAQYDNPFNNPDGQARPGANNNGSGVAIMLELIRTINESGYQPFKTLLFVAYSGEGLEQEQLITNADPSQLLSASGTFGSAFELEAMITLRGLGDGTGSGLDLSTSGSQRLANLFEMAAYQAGVSTTRVDEAVDLGVIFRDDPFQESQKVPQIGLQWQGWQTTADTPLDTVDRISHYKLEQAGETLSLALMMIAREKIY